jgi:hypothetical protein
MRFFTFFKRLPQSVTRGRRVARPRVEDLEPRRLPSGFWAPVARAVPDGDGAQVMMLLSDGTVMVQGEGGNTVGFPNENDSAVWYNLTPDLSGNYVNGTWSHLTPMGTARRFFASNVLTDGRVFVEGGEYSGPHSDQNWINTGEIYNPVANTWTSIQNFPQSSFGDDPSEVLSNGTVLVGYLSGGQTYLYNPGNDTWTTTGAKLRGDRSDEESWLKLPDGSILSYDVFASESTGVFHAQRYVPGRGAWVDASKVDPLNAPALLSSSNQGEELGAGLLLPDGRAWFLGANGNTAFYTPSTDTWSAGPILPKVNGTNMVAADAPAAVLPNGHVLMALSPLGALDAHGEYTFPAPTRIYEYDPATGFTDVSPGGLNQPSYTTTMLVLPTGQVLLANDSGTVLEYTPDGAPQDAWRPTISGIRSNGDGTFTLSGTQLNGLSEGAAYGDDAEMASNYPLVRVTNFNREVEYARTFNWSSTGVATGSTPETVTFTMPPLAGDINFIQVIGNGIASAPVLYVVGDSLVTDNTITLGTTTVNGVPAVTVNENGAFSDWFGPTAIIVQPGSGSDTINVSRTLASAPVTVLGGPDDTVHIGDPFLGAQGILGAVNVSNDTGGTALYVSDSGDTTGQNIALYEGALYGLAPAPIYWTPTSASTGGVTFLNVTGGSGPNTWDVYGTSDFASWTYLNTGGGHTSQTVTVNVHATTGGLFVDGGSGSQVVTVGDGGSMQGINGFVYVENTNSSGSSSVYLDDRNDPTGRTVTLTNSSVSGLSRAPVDYASGVNSIKVYGGRGGDLYILAGVNMPITLDGPGDDTFRFNDQASITGAIDGGPGFNTLDYRAYTTPVVVNLVTGQATGVGGGVKNIQSVLGGTVVFTVTNTQDAGPGSLRQAILDANARPGADVIDFAIPGSGVQTIAVGSTTGLPLPASTDSITIDGYSQPGARANTLTTGDNAVLLIQLEGSHAGAGANGLTISAGVSTVRGLVINRFLQTPYPANQGGIGILLDANGGNVIQGNYLGTDAAGTIALPNFVGVQVQGGGSNNLIGGATPAARNLLSANISGGLLLYNAGTGNLVQGNYIGTNAAGTAALENLSGVWVGYGAAAHNSIGGTAPGAGNLISGNSVGVNLSVGANNNLIQGNYIGTNSSGTAALGNSYGVFLQIYTSSNLIGGTAPSSRNIISGNSLGIYFINNPVGNQVEGNYIGTDPSGTAAVGNGVGVALQNASADNTIGGTAAAGNIISGNVLYGIYLHDPDVSGNLVQGNSIGVSAAGTPLGNGGDGVHISLGAHDNQIGGPLTGSAAEFGNRIAFNGGAGVAVVDATSTGNAIRGNSIHDNAALGIDLAADGVTPDGPAPRTGPNQLQNYPQLSSVQGGNTTRITGILNALPNTTYVLDFYASAVGDPSSFGQGQRYLGSGPVSTDANGDVTFDSAAFAALGASSPGEIITATATDPAGNTSEFSSFLSAGGSYVTAEGASLTLQASYLAIAGGSPVTYTWDVNGDGTFGDSTGPNPTLSWSQLVALGVADGPATFRVRVRITDANGNSAMSAATSFQLNNAPPTALLAGPGNGVPGQPRTFTFSAADPSPIDQAAGFSYAIDWGDGTTVQTIAAAAGNGTGVAVDHVYTSPGSYSVRVAATDKDGGSSPTASAVVTVNVLQMEGNTLAVGGTLGNDTIVLSPADTVGDINVNMNGTSLGSFLPTDHILVYGQTGNDTIQLASKKFRGVTYYIAVPAFLYGEAAAGDKDILDAAGSMANNVLSGGAGTNQLFGGLGRDLLIAGLGASQLHAGSGEDILIGGWTDYDLSSTAMTYDRKLQALEAILAEWGRTDLGTPADPTGYLARVNHLLGPGAGGTAGGLNGSAYLNGGTVHASAVSDTLFGAPSPILDWFLAGSLDVLKIRRDGEVVTTIF